MTPGHDVFQAGHGIAAFEKLIKNVEKKDFLLDKWLSLI
jgi:hypothetical protein